MARSTSPLLAGFGILVLAAPVLASHVAPRLVDGAESCAPLTPGTIELVVDAGALTEGTVSEAGFEANVELVGTVETGSIAFSDASLPVRSAFVAGTDGGNLYEYEEPVTEDDGLVAPDGTPITSVSFCYVDEEDGGGAPAEGEATDDGGATGDGETAGGDGGDRTAPPTDTAGAAATGDGPATGLLLVVAGLGCLAGAALLVGPRRLQRAARPVTVRRRR